MPGPDQLKSVPVVVAPESEIEVVVQVNVPPVALAPGGVIFASKRAVAELVQPLVGSSTLTVYVPDALTSGVAVVPPETIPGPDHVKPAPSAELDAESVTDVVVQVNVPPVVPMGGPCNGTSTGARKPPLVLNRSPRIRSHRWPVPGSVMMARPALLISCLLLTWESAQAVTFGLSSTFAPCTKELSLPLLNRSTAMVSRSTLGLPTSTGFLVPALVTMLIPLRGREILCLTATPTYFS